MRGQSPFAKIVLGDLVAAYGGKQTLFQPGKFIGF
jgi:hypothetical protein